MNRSPVLLNIVKAMFATLALAFLFVLFSSLSGPDLSSSKVKLFDDIALGQTAIRRYDGERVWVTRLSDPQRKHALELAPNLIDPSAGCSPAVVLCVLSAVTSRSGIEIVYSDKAPAQLPAQIPWYGGFVDPINGRVFDRLGRAYRGVASGSVSLSVIDIVDD